MQRTDSSPALPAAPDAVRRLGPVAWAILIGVALRLVLIAVVPLGNDEAYHVDWARHLQPGYLDHPPAVAWLMALPVRTLGAHPLAVRLPALILQTLALAMASSLVQARAGERAALAVAVGLQAAPLFSLGAALIAPDAPLAFAWVGALWALQRALDRGPRWALLAGAFLGLGALSKLTAGLLGVALLAALVATRDGRRLLATPWPWLGAALAAALASPMLLWNVAHGWPSFTFQASHGLSGRGFSAARLLASLGGQLAYVSPVLLVLSAVAAWRALLERRDALQAALAFSALPVAAFFTAAAAFTPNALPHWPAPGWLSALLALCLTGAVGTRGWRWALRIGLGEIAVGLTVLAVLLAVPLPPSIAILGRTIAIERGPARRPGRLARGGGRGARGGGARPAGHHPLDRPRAAGVVRRALARLRRRARHRAVVLRPGSARRRPAAAGGHRGPPGPAARLAGAEVRPGRAGRVVPGAPGRAGGAGVPVLVVEAVATASHPNPNLNPGVRARGPPPESRGPRPVLRHRTTGFGPGDTGLGSRVTRSRVQVRVRVRVKPATPPQ